ncbi:sugar transferase [bacterium]|nr:sugar transferase [bacterium]
MFINTDFKIKSKKIILLLGDMFFLYLSLFLTLLIRFGNTFNLDIFQRLLLHFSIIYIFWLMIIFSFRFYESSRALFKKYDLIVNIFNISIINFFLSVLYFYIIPQNIITPKTILIINILIFGIVFYFWRIIAHNFLFKNLKQKNCLVITNSQDLIQHIIKKPELELDINLFVNPSNELKINSEKLNEIKIEHINYSIRGNKIQTIVIDDELLNQKNISDQLFECLKLRLEIIKTTDFYQKFLGKIPVKNINSVWVMNNFNESHKSLFDLVKNVLDKIFSIIFLTISIIFIPFIVIAIKLDSKGPIFFKQIRTTKNNKTFLAIKFRSMRIDAEKNGPQWASENDPRVTKIGNFLRKSRLDEIPQLINILKGDMSLVGPRPERPEFIKDLKKQISFYDQRLLVKPGLTGWTQINYPYGNTVQDALEKLQYDLYYIKNRSFILDLSIILKTLNTVIKKSGM